MAERIGDGGGVAVGVVAEIGRVAAGGGLRRQLAELVVDPRQRALERARRVLGVFLDPVAGVVQRVVQRVAGVVGDIGQAVCRVVGEGGERAIRLRHLLDQTGRPVVDQGDAVVALAAVVATADLAGGEPATRVVGVVGDGAVGVLHRQHAAGAVVGQVFGHLAQSVGDFPEVALAMRASRRRRSAGRIVGWVIGVAGTVADIGARTIYRLQIAQDRAGAVCCGDIGCLTVAVSHVAPLAGGCANCRHLNGLKPIIARVGSGASSALDRKHPVGAGGRPGRGGTFLWEPKSLLDGMDAHVHAILGQVRIAMLGLDTKPIGHGAEPPAIVGRLIVVGVAHRAVASCHGRDLRRFAARGGHRVIGRVAQRIGDAGAGRRIREGDAVDAAGMLAGDCAPGIVVGEGAETLAVFRGDARQMAREAGVLVVIGPAAAIGIGHGYQTLLVVAVAGHLHAVGDNAGDQRVVVVVGVHQFDGAALQRGDALQPAARVVGIHQPAAILPHTRDQLALGVEGIDGVLAIQYPLIAIGDDALAGGIGRAIVRAHFAERNGITATLHQAQRIALDRQMQAVREGPAWPEPSSVQGNARMVVTRQGDPAQIEIALGLEFLAGLDVAGIADHAGVAVAVLAAVWLSLALQGGNFDRRDDPLVRAGLVADVPRGVGLGTVSPL